MPRFKLICDHSCDLDTHVVTHEFSAEYLPEVIQNIDMFLKGAGYIYDGYVDILEDNPPQVGAGTNFQSGGAGVQRSQYFYDTERNR